MTSVWHVISAFTRLERSHCCSMPLQSCWVAALEARASTAKGRKGALPLINTEYRWRQKQDYSLRKYSFFRLIYPEKFWNCSDCSVKLGHVHETRSFLGLKHWYGRLNSDLLIEIRQIFLFKLHCNYPSKPKYNFPGDYIVFRWIEIIQWELYSFNIKQV